MTTVMNTLTNSTLNTLNLVWGAMLVNSNKKLITSEKETRIEKVWSRAREFGISLNSPNAGRMYWAEMNASIETKTS